MNHLVIFITFILLLCLFTKKNNIENFKCKGKKRQKRLCKNKIMKKKINSKYITDDEKKNLSCIKDGKKCYYDHQLCIPWDRDSEGKILNYKRISDQLYSGQNLIGTIKNVAKGGNNRFIWENNKPFLWDQWAYQPDEKKESSGKTYGKVPFELCQDKKGNIISDIYKGKIARQNCIKAGNEFINVYNNNPDIQKEWIANEKCNRIYPYNDEYIHTYDNDFNKHLRNGTCTTYTDDKCSKIDKIIKFQNNFPNDFPKDLK